MWMRGGTSKGGVFLGSDLPSEERARDALLLRLMGSPDPRQIDGMGGATPLTSKVALVGPSRHGADVDYLFLQVFVDRPLVSASQNCGNMLAAVGPFAIERGLVEPAGDVTPVRIFMENTGQVAVAEVPSPGGRVSYAGDARIDGVPGTASAIPISFEGTAGSTCGALLPTGRAVDTVEGARATLIDDGMPTVVLSAAQMGIEGGEAPAELEAMEGLRARLERIRLACGPLMNLGDVSGASVPKMCMVSASAAGGAIRTRTFIPHRCHEAIGVLGAVSVASACLLEEGPAAEVARLPEGPRRAISVEHPTGEFTVIAEGGRAAVLRTARKLMDGLVFPAP